MSNQNINELEKIVKHKNVSIDKNTKETLLLLSGEENRAEIEILKSIGLDNHIKKVETIKNDLKRVEIITNIYNRKTYSGKDIAKYCVINDYKLLRADNFKSKTPEKVAKDILQFIKENETTSELSETRTVTKSKINVRESSFFILAKKSDFEKGLNSATLFYREERNDQNYNRASKKDVFIEVSSWGTPKSNFWNFIPYLFFYKNDNNNHAPMFKLAIFAITFTCTVATLFPKFDAISLYWIIPAFIATILSSIFTNSEFYNKWNQ